MAAYWERKQVPAEDLGMGWETGVWVWTVNPEKKGPGQAQGFATKSMSTARDGRVSFYYSRRTWTPPMPRLCGACSVTHDCRHRSIWSLCYSPGLLSETLSDKNPDLLRKLGVPLSFSFLSAWLPTSCLLGASHSLGDTWCVPSQIWRGAEHDPSATSCAWGGACGLESPAWLGDRLQH